MRFLFLFFAASLSALPEQFQITERFFSLATTFDLETESAPFGVATRRFFSLTPIYDLYDDKDQLLATACSRLCSWGTTADVTDALGKSIGRMEENLWRIFPWAEYKIFNADDELIATATMDLLGTEFTIITPENNVLASINRPLFRWFRDDWNVKILSKELAIDDRLLAFLAVYQTDKDNRTRFYYEFQEQIRQEWDSQDSLRY